VAIGVGAAGLELRAEEVVFADVSQGIRVQRMSPLGGSCWSSWTDTGVAHAGETVYLCNEPTSGQPPARQRNTTESSHHVLEAAKMGRYALEREVHATKAPSERGCWRLVDCALESGRVHIEAPAERSLSERSLSERSLSERSLSIGGVGTGMAFGTEP